MLLIVILSEFQDAKWCIKRMGKDNLLFTGFLALVAIIDTSIVGSIIYLLIK